VKCVACGARERDGVCCLGACRSALRLTLALHSLGALHRQFALFAAPTPAPQRADPARLPSEATPPAAPASPPAAAAGHVLVWQDERCAAVSITATDACACACAFVTAPRPARHPASPRRWSSSRARCAWATRFRPRRCRAPLANSLTCRPLPLPQALPSQMDTGAARQLVGHPFAARRPPPAARRSRTCRVAPPTDLPTPQVDVALEFLDCTYGGALANF
jgi:hypothetical protein